MTKKCKFCGLEVDFIVKHMIEKHPVEWQEYCEEEENFGGCFL